MLSVKCRHGDGRRTIRWATWIVAGLVIVNGGWMLFDGARALVVGDYVSPRSGAHAGQLGPWSKLVAAVGIDPRSTLMKSVFVVYGVTFLVMLTAFLLGAKWAWWGLIVVAALGLWHLPFGTLINLAVIVLLQLSGLRDPSGP